MFVNSSPVALNDRLVHLGADGRDDDDGGGSSILISDAPANNDKRFGRVSFT